MKRSRRGSPPVVNARTSLLGAALDELRFGRARTLNLRETLPTPEAAVARTEAWLRERQVARAGEVLVITGRGNSSPGGVSPVREAVCRLFRQLTRRGVIAGVQEHTPGSFVVRLAPLTRLFEAPRSRRHPTPPPVADPQALAGLPEDTRRALRTLAERSLDALGVRRPTPAQVEREMEKQFALLAAGVAVAAGPERERRLHRAIEAALWELEEG